MQLAVGCLLAQGHLLVEDLPGLGKTTLAKALARSLGLDFHRVQFTADLLAGRRDRRHGPRSGFEGSPCSVRAPSSPTC